MSDKTSSNQINRNKPEYIIVAVDNEGEHDKWTNIGVAYKNEQGYIEPLYQVLPHDHEKVIFQPRKELERLREEVELRELKAIPKITFQH